MQVICTRDSTKVLKASWCLCECQLLYRNSIHFCLESCGRFTSQKLKILWANNWLAKFYTFLMIHTVLKHTLIMALTVSFFVYTSALERQALCKGVRHWLSLVLTLALPFVIKTSTISAYPIKAAACKGDLFSESRLLTASGSFSRISSTSSMLPAIMACTRGGWKIQKSISVIWWNSIIVFFVILTSNFKSVILVKSGDKTSTDPLLLPAWARPQKF